MHKLIVMIYRFLGVNRANGHKMNPIGFPNTSDRFVKVSYAQFPIFCSERKRAYLVARSHVAFR